MYVITIAIMITRFDMNIHVATVHLARQTSLRSSSRVSRCSYATRAMCYCSVTRNIVTGECVPRTQVRAYSELDLRYHVSSAF